MFDALHNFVQFVQFKKREKQPWRSDTFSKLQAKASGVFMFLKLYKQYQITQSV